MKFNVLIFFSVQGISAFRRDIFFKQPTKSVNLDLVKAVNFIIENVYLKLFSTVNIVSAVQNPTEPYYLDFKDALFNENKGFCIYRLDNFTKIQGIRNRLKIYNVFLLDSYESFRVLIKNITPEKFKYRGRYLFVFIYGRLEEHSIIFPAMWKKGIINVNTLYEERNINGDDEVHLDTFMPFQENKCGDTSRVFLDTLENGTFTIGSDELFPNKLDNLFGCELRLVTFERCPASCIKLVESEITVEGFDISIIDLIASRMNFQLNKKILLGSQQWGTILPNGTTTPKGNAISRLLNNESDIAIGNFLLRSSRVNLLEPSVVYFSFPILFAIPPGERYTAFEKLMRPFGIVVWILILITICVGLLVILVLNLKWRQLRSFVYGTEIKHPATNMYRISCI